MDLGDGLVAEEDVEDGVEVGGAKGEGVLVEGVADPKGAPSEPDLPLLLDLADLVTGLIGDGGKDLGEAA
jgi:hypothetical protein